MDPGRGTRLSPRADKHLMRKLKKLGKLESEAEEVEVLSSP